MVTAAWLVCDHSCWVNRFRECYYFWIPDASLGHRNVLSTTASRVFHRPPTGHLDISVFREGYPRADLMGSEHLPAHLLIYPECHKIDSLKICPVRSWEGYPAFSPMCRWPNATFCSYLPFTSVQTVRDADVGLSCCQWTLHTFSLVGRVQGHLVHIWAAQQPPCSYACTQAPASLFLSCILTPWLGFAWTSLLPMDLPSEHRTEADPDHCLRLDPDTWCSASCLPCCHPWSLLASFAGGILKDVLLFWMMSITEALEPVPKIFVILHLESFWACGRGFWLS